VEVDLEAGGRVAVSEVLPVGAVEGEALWSEAVEREEAAVAEAAEQAVGIED
jgi:hypothetical protein